LRRHDEWRRDEWRHPRPAGADDLTPRLSRPGHPPGMKPWSGDAASVRTVTVTRPISRKLAALACGLALVSSPALAACTDKNNSATASPSASASSGPVPQAALCADAAALRDSVGRLVNVTVVPGMADEIRADANAVKADLTTFATNAHGSY